MEKIKFRIEKGPHENSVCTVYLNNMAIAYAFSHEASLLQKALEQLVDIYQYAALMERIRELSEAVLVYQEIREKELSGETDKDGQNFYKLMRVAVVDTTPAPNPKGVV